MFLYLTDLKVRVSGEYEILVVGKKPLQRFGDADLVSKSADHQLHDMFPILPTIDMVPYNRYTVQEHGCMYISRPPDKRL